MARNPEVSHELLSAALAGLELQKGRIEEQISEVRAMLGSGATRRGRRAKNAGSMAEEMPSGKASTKKARGKRRLSPEGRARIAEAARKRWAAQREAAGE